MQSFQISIDLDFTKQLFCKQFSTILEGTGEGGGGGRGGTTRLVKSMSVQSKATLLAGIPVLEIQNTHVYNLFSVPA